MKITKISRQKKRGRYNIFIDDEFAFGAYEDTIIKYSLASGDEIDEKKIESIKDTDEFNHARRSAFSLLSYRQRSRKELENKLKEKKIPEKNITRALDFLEEKNFINDGEYAKIFLESMLSRKPAGKSLLVRKLKEKGIEGEIIDRIMQERFKEDTEIVSAISLLKKYSKKTEGLKEFERKKKAYRYLHSRGFGFDIISRAWSDLNR